MRSLGIGVLVLGLSILLALPVTLVLLLAAANLGLYNIKGGASGDQTFLDKYSSGLYWVVAGVLVLLLLWVVRCLRTPQSQ